MTAIWVGRYNRGFVQLAFRRNQGRRCLDCNNKKTRPYYYKKTKFNYFHCIRNISGDDIKDVTCFYNDLPVACTGKRHWCQWRASDVWGFFPRTGAGITSGSILRVETKTHRLERASILDINRHLRESAAVRGKIRHFVTTIGIATGCQRVFYVCGTPASRSSFPVIKKRKGISKIITMRYELKDSLKQMTSDRSRRNVVTISALIIRVFKRSRTNITVQQSTIIKNIWIVYIIVSDDEEEEGKRNLWCDFVFDVTHSGAGVRSRCHFGAGRVFDGRQLVAAAGQRGHVVSHPRRDLRVPETGRVAGVVVRFFFLEFLPLETVRRILGAPMFRLFETAHKTLENKSTLAKAARDKKKYNITW